MKELKNIMIGVQGYIFVMINPKYSGLVRISKTAIKPKDNLKELFQNQFGNQYTFIFQRFFDNSIIAEYLIHRELEFCRECNYDIREQSLDEAYEFFRIESAKAIDVINSIDINSVNPRDLAEEYKKWGDRYADGWKDYIPFPDYNAAICYYRRAAVLGFDTMLYLQLGDLEVNYGDIDKGIKAYEAAIECGETWCYARIAQVYAEVPTHRNSHQELRAWNSFFFAINRVINQMNIDEILDSGWRFSLYVFFKIHLDNIKLLNWHDILYFLKLKKRELIYAMEIQKKETRPDWVEEYKVITDSIFFLENL